MRVIAKKALVEFWQKYPEVEQALTIWYHDARQAKWKAPSDIKKYYPSASILKGGRVVFNIKGNKFRLIVDVNYSTQIIYVRFVGTHKEYDEIDADHI